MKTPLPEAIDRFSILTLKLEHVTDEKKRAMVQKEYDFYQRTIDAYKEDGIAVKGGWITDMVAINRKCWDLEDAIREGRDDKLGLEEVGRRALQLRELNKERIAIKNKIAEEIGLDFFEIKINHASA